MSLLATKPKHAPTTPLKSCAMCPFGGAKVSSRGPIDSPFVIVGESPGIQEVVAHVPFVGPSGEVIDRALEIAGYTPEQCGSKYIEPFITNALQCMPNKNNKQTMLPQATECCKRRLQEEVGAHPREVILALGNAAAWALTGDFSIKITQERGRLLNSTLASKGIILAVHPAFLLRGGGSLPQFKQDISYAVSMYLEGKKKEPIPTVMSLVDTVEKLKAVVLSYKDAPLIAADIETGGFDHQRDEILCLGISKGMSPSGKGILVHMITEAVLAAPEAKEHLQELMGSNEESPSRSRWVWHNGKFDVKFFHTLGINARVDEDTMLMSYCLDETKGIHSLEDVAADRLGAPPYKNMLKPYLPKKDSSYRVVPKPVLHNYGALDVSYTYQIFNCLQPLLAADEVLLKLYTKLLIPASAMLASVEFTGMLVDPQAIQFNMDDLTAQMEEPLRIIQAVSQHYLGTSINPNSPIQLKELLYKRMNLAPLTFSTDADALDSLDQVPVVVALKKYRKLNKLLSTYVKPFPAMIGTDNRIHPTFKINGTITGRLASADPNFQNMPRGPYIRRQFIAALRHRFGKVDLNQAELRVLAIMSNDPLLVKIYTENKISIHHVTSVSFFGEDYDDEQKMRAKAVNFGIVYGREAPSLAEEFDIPVAEAMRWIKKWFETYPGAKEFLDKLGQAPALGQIITTVFGRKKRWGVVSQERLRNMQNEAKNFPMQSTASDIVLETANALYKGMKKLNTNLVNLVHDELMWEIPEEDECLEPFVLQTTIDAFREVPKLRGLLRVPFIGEADTGTRWGELKKGYIPDPEKVAAFRKTSKYDMFMSEVRKTHPQLADRLSLQ